MAQHVFITAVIGNLDHYEAASSRHAAFRHAAFRNLIGMHFLYLYLTNCVYCLRI